MDLSTKPKRPANDGHQRPPSSKRPADPATQQGHPWAKHPCQQPTSDDLHIGSDWGSQDLARIAGTNPRPSHEDQNSHSISTTTTTTTTHPRPGCSFWPSPSDEDLGDLSLPLDWRHVTKRQNPLAHAEKELLNLVLGNRSGASDDEITIAQVNLEPSNAVVQHQRTGINSDELLDIITRRLDPQALGRTADTENPALTMNHNTPANTLIEPDGTPQAQSVPPHPSTSPRPASPELNRLYNIIAEKINCLTSPYLIIKSSYLVPPNGLREVMLGQLEELVKIRTWLSTASETTSLETARTLQSVRTAANMKKHTQRFEQEKKKSAKYTADEHPGIQLPPRKYAPLDSDEITISSLTGSPINNIIHQAINKLPIRPHLRSVPGEPDRIKLKFNNLSDTLIARELLDAELPPDTRAHTHLAITTKRTKLMLRSGLIDSNRFRAVYGNTIDKANEDKIINTLVRLNREIFKWRNDIFSVSTSSPDTTDGCPKIRLELVVASRTFDHVKPKSKNTEGKWRFNLIRVYDDAPPTKTWIFPVFIPPQCEQCLGTDHLTPMDRPCDLQVCKTCGDRYCLEGKPCSTKTKKALDAINSILKSHRGNPTAKEKMERWLKVKINFMAKLANPLVDPLEKIGDVDDLCTDLNIEVRYRCPVCLSFTRHEAPHSGKDLKCETLVHLSRQIQEDTLYWEGGF